MVNAPETLESDAPVPERRASARVDVLSAGVLGATKLHPFGDLHAIQHLSVRLARGVRTTFETFLRAETRAWAEPLEVMSYADYRAQRGERLTAWQQIQMDDRLVLAVLDGAFVHELLDLFFGGTGDAPAALPTDFSPTADALVGRIARGLADALNTAWEPLAHAEFAPGRCEANVTLLGGIDAEEIVVATRFGVARGTAKPVFVDIVYPVAALKPHTNVLTGKVVAKPVEADAQWQTQLTRATMGVRFPVRSVLAEPRVSLARLMDLKPGDVIPISFGSDIPVMVGGTAIGTGTVGTSNGRAAIRISRLEGPLS